MALHPHTKGQAKALLFLVDGFIGQPIMQGFFVKVAQVFTFHLPLAGYLAGKGNELVVEHRVGDFYASHGAHVVDLSQVVVGQGELPVEVKHAV